VSYHTPNVKSYQIILEGRGLSLFIHQSYHHIHNAYKIYKFLFLLVLKLGEEITRTPPSDKRSLSYGSASNIIRARRNTSCTFGIERHDIETTKGKGIILIYMDLKRILVSGYRALAVGADDIVSPTQAAAEPIQGLVTS
jgi:hypothetical protein